MDIYLCVVYICEFVIFFTTKWDMLKVGLSSSPWTCHRTFVLSALWYKTLNVGMSFLYFLCIVVVLILNLFADISFFLSLLPLSLVLIPLFLASCRFHARCSLLFLFGVFFFRTLFQN